MKYPRLTAVETKFCLFVEQVVYSWECFWHSISTLLPLDPLWARRFLISNFLSFMAPQKCSARHLLPTEHCCFTWAKNKNRYKWLSKFHSYLNAFYLSARKVLDFCSCFFWRNFLCQAQSDCTRIWILKIQVCRPLKSPQVLMSFSGGQPRALRNQQFPGEMFNILLPNPLRPPVMLMDFFSCCLDINSAY